MHDPQPTHTIDLDEADPQTGPTTIAAAILGFLVLASSFWLEALYRRTADEERMRKVISQESAELRTLQANQLDQLQQYRWVDPTHGVVSVPIERAMKLVIAESKAGHR
jgi:hypothetical protein